MGGKLAKFMARMRHLRDFTKRMIRPLPDPILPFDPDGPGIRFYSLGTMGSAPGHGNQQTSCSMIEIEGYRVMIDAGTGLFLNYPRNHDPMEETDAIVLTHLHPDHFSDLPNFIVPTVYGIRGRGFELPAVDLYKRKKIFGPPGTKDTILRILNPVITELLDEKEYATIEETANAIEKILEDRLKNVASELRDHIKEKIRFSLKTKQKTLTLISEEVLEKAFEIIELPYKNPNKTASEEGFLHTIDLHENIRLHVDPVDHKKAEAFGLRFEIGKSETDEKTIISFSGDTTNHPALNKIARGSTLFICDRGGPQSPVHMSLYEGAAVASKVGVKNIAGIHPVPWDGVEPWIVKGLTKGVLNAGGSNAGVEMLIPGTVYELELGKLGPAIWIDTGQQVTKYERRVHDNGYEVNMKKYFPRESAFLAKNDLPRNPPLRRKIFSGRRYRLRAATTGPKLHG